MRRLVITGLACPPESWEKLLGSSSRQRVISLHEILEHTDSADPRLMSYYVTAQIEAFQPDSIVCHDLGVPLTLLSLLRLNRRGVAVNAKVTLFNGAFRKYDIFRSPHVFRVQMMPYWKGVQEIEAHGGKVDPRLKKYFPRIRAMYRLIILFGMTEKVSSALGLEDLIGLRGKMMLKSPLQIIASRNDPYIPIEAVEQIRREFNVTHYTELDYGHFPYSISSPLRIREILEAFEQSDAPRAKAKSSTARRRAPRESSQEAQL